LKNKTDVEKRLSLDIAFASIQKEMDSLREIGKKFVERFC